MAHTSVYSRIMVMCIESCALIVVVGVAYTVIFLNNFPGLEIPLYLLPQICVISPLMIVYRVAHGKDATSTKTPLSVGNMIEREIHFVMPNSTGDIAE
ncbi:hypothetical protein GALMADRAFT_592405 [Galerina marginata CBS 339.88]|uniref:Uncharacterized protein n=1 Tax=Galerina marginata (strain CBS 339.88) TaxID=685588 RepID=A0A067SSA9_GALM3|nr:hypothetical protein GALMADRAFT_592405 [Galerina marginata CBS 339.88]